MSERAVSVTAAEAEALRGWVAREGTSRTSFDAVFLDLVYLGRLVRAGGIVFLDDYQLPAVARAASFCTTNLGWKVEEPKAPPERSYDHFVDF